MRPATNSGRLSDLRSFYVTAQTDISSCAVGLRDSLTALVAVVSGRTGERRTAEGIAVSGAQSCSPVSNGSLFDLATSTAPTSLQSYGAQNDAQALYNWAYPGAALAQGQIYRFLAHSDAPGDPAARALFAELSKLRASGVQVLDGFQLAARRLGASLPPLSPSITPTPPKILLGR